MILDGRDRSTITFACAGDGRHRIAWYQEQIAPSCGVFGASCGASCLSGASCLCGASYGVVDAFDGVGDVVGGVSCPFGFVAVVVAWIVKQK